MSMCPLLADGSRVAEACARNSVIYVTKGVSIRRLRTSTYSLTWSAWHTLANALLHLEPRFVDSTTAGYIAIWSATLVAIIENKRKQVEIRPVLEVTFQ